jgi:DinB superfamily
MKTADAMLAILEEGYRKKAWHGPTLKQSLKGVTAKQAAWRPGKGRHNIWELTLHAAYWKYAARRRLVGGKQGSFVLKGHNFFLRPEQGKFTESAWIADKAILENEHRELRRAMSKALGKSPDRKKLRTIYGVALHDVYHTGQIRLLRRLMERA